MKRGWDGIILRRFLKPVQREYVYTMLLNIVFNCCVLYKEK